MRLILFFLFAISLGSCSNSGSKNELVDYFYPLEGKGSVYVYRDMKNPIVEQFQRIYRVEDSEGKHLVVEIYSSDARIIEAYNYNLDSLDLMDHMVVNRNGRKTKAELFRNRLFPMNTKDETYFVSRFQGFLDSTMILHEVQRSVRPKKAKATIDVMGKKKQALVFQDNIRTTMFNPFTKQEKEFNERNYSYFVKGFGLVRWEDINKTIDYRLERIISEEDWVKFVNQI